jgi:hypothetical protein
LFVVPPAEQPRRHCAGCSVADRPCVSLVGNEASATARRDVSKLTRRRCCDTACSMLPYSRSDLVVVRGIADVHKIAFAEGAGAVTTMPSGRGPGGATILNQAREGDKQERSLKRISQHIPTPMRSLNRETPRPLPFARVSEISRSRAQYFRQHRALPLRS